MDAHVDEDAAAAGQIGGGWRDDIAQRRPQQGWRPQVALPHEVAHPLVVGIEATLEADLEAHAGR